MATVSTVSLSTVLAACVEQDHADREWKFARSKLWMGYYDEGSTLPPPFNLIVSPKSVFYLLCRLKRFLLGCIVQQKRREKQRRKVAARLAKRKAQSNNEEGTKRSAERRKYEDVMRRLVSRFIHQWKKQLRQDGVSEDDLLEIKQDISSLRYELREDRKKGEFQSALHMENLKRDILRFIGNSFSGDGTGPSHHHHHSGLSRDSSVDDKIDGALGGGDGLQHRATSTSCPPQIPDELTKLKRDIIRSLRSELVDIAREISQTGDRTFRTTAAAPAGQSVSLPVNSELYQTHLYTQL